MIDQNSTTSARYLTIVKDELGSRLKPALEAGQLQQVAMCGQFILSNLVTQTNALPALRAAAMDEIAGLIASLKPVLNQGDGQQWLAALEASLQGPRDFQQVEAALQQVSKSLTEKQGDAMATKLNKQIVGIETRLHSGFLKAYQEEIARSSVSTDSKDVLSAQQVAQLTQWMRERFTGNETLEISGLKAIPGGFSKHTIFVFLKNAKTLPGTVVVRLDWSASVVGTTVANEFRIIETLFNAGVKVPQPYALEASGKVLGGPFLLLSKAEGSNPGDSFDVPNGSKAFAQDLALTLAKMHTVPVESFGDAVAGAKETTRARLLREIAEFEATWRSMNQPSASMETAFAWLKQNIALADGPRSLIHKDPGCHNMLAHGDKLSVLLDWETAAIGNPAQDLGYVYPLVIQMCVWSDFMAAYVEAGGPAISQAQVDYHTLWGYTWVNSMVMQAEQMFVSGVANEIRAGFAGTYLLSRTEARLREKLHSLL